MNPDEFADKYNSDAYLLPNHMYGFRSWRIIRLWPSIFSWRRYRLVSYTTEHIWMPDASLKASCRIHWSQKQFYQRNVHPAAKVLIYPFIAIIFFAALITGIIQTSMDARSNPLSIFTEIRVTMGFLMILFLWLALMLLYGLPAAKQRWKRTRPHIYGVHEAPVDSCTCGIFANTTLEHLEAELIRMRKHGWGQQTFSPHVSLLPGHRRAYVIGEVVTAGMRPRALSGSIGFRASEMAISGETFYLIAGTQKMAAALGRIYGKRVVTGYPPSFTKLTEK